MEGRSTPMVPMIGAKRLSLILALVAMFTAIAYVGPSFWVRRPLPEGQLSLVVIIESAGPVWPVLFFVASGVVAASAMSRRYVGYAHSVAAGVWGFYGTAVLLSAVYAEPPSPILTGGLALGATLIHLGMIRVWSDLGVK